jgi:hypothetical protein
MPLLVVDADGVQVVVAEDVIQVDRRSLRSLLIPKLLLPSHPLMTSLPSRLLVPVLYVVTCTGRSTAQS